MTDEERKAKNREYQRAYRERHGETRREYMRQWRADNSDRMRAARKRWVGALTPEERVEFDRRRSPAAVARAAAWNRAHPERRAAITRKHDRQEHVRAKARMRNYSHEAREYVAILAADPCAYCDQPCEHIDHIVPLARGGSGLPDNLTAACATCNVSKNAKPLLTFLLDRR